jgi:hypothetical protein
MLTKIKEYLFGSTEKDLQKYETLTKSIETNRLELDMLVDEYYEIQTNYTKNLSEIRKSENEQERFIGEKIATEFQKYFLKYVQRVANIKETIEKSETETKALLNRNNNLHEAIEQKKKEDALELLERAFLAGQISFETIEKARGNNVEKPKKPELSKEDAALIILEKAFQNGQNTLETIEKARAGVYANTPENKKLNRVGQKYGSKKTEEGKTDKDKAEKTESKEVTPEAKEKLTEHAKTASETDLQAAIKTSADSNVREAAHQELDRREKEEHVQEEEEPEKKESEPKELKEGDATNIGIIEEVYGMQYKIDGRWYHKSIIKPIETENKEAVEQMKVNSIISKLEEKYGKGDVTLYHGTDSDSASEINKKGKFGKDSTVSFFTNSKKEAKEYSENKAKYRNKKGGNVLEFTLPKWAALKNSGTGEFETEFEFEKRNDKWYPTNKSILSQYGDDITKAENNE